MADVLGFFKKAFPFIATGLSLAGPPGNAAAAILGKVLSVDKPSSATVSSALANLTLTPELQAQLQEAEMQYKAMMQSVGYEHVEELESIAAADRADARSREVQTHDWYPKALATLVVVLCFLGEGLYFRHGAPANASPELIGRILGTLDSALILVLGYYFGSSAGSARKNEIIASQQKGQ